MHINKIRLVNFRGMTDLTVDFKPGVNIIIGDNGAGKTSLLNGLAVALSRPFAYLGHDNFKSIEKEDVRTTLTFIGDTTTKTEYHTPVIMECNLELENTNYFYGCESMGSDGNFKTYSQNLNGGPIFQKKIENLINNNDSILPLFNYQSDKRDFFKKKRNKKKIEFQNIEREMGYYGCVSGRSALETVQNWCFQMELNAFQRKIAISEYETFKKIVSEFIGIIEETETKKNIFFSSEQWTLVYSDNKTIQPLYNLSAGYQGIIYIIMELAYRAVVLNPTMDYFKTLEGIVIIDEIDMHLHPKWQWKILDALQETFPKVQFIVATHSPIIISSAKNANLIKMINPNEVKPLQQKAYGYNISDVVEFCQGSTELPQEAKNLKNELENEVNNDNFEKAEQIINTAIEKFGEDSSPVKEMKDFLEVNKWIEDAE